jgi:hypothetical protein
MFVCVVLLGTFTKLRKVAVSFIMAGWLSVYMEQLTTDWLDFLESLYLRTFRICATKDQFVFKSDKNNRYFTWTPMYMYDNIWLKSS